MSARAACECFRGDGTEVVGVMRGGSGPDFVNTAVGPEQQAVGTINHSLMLGPFQTRTPG